VSPGVFVEETHSRSKSIVGVDTGAAGFVGPTPRRPAEDRPKPLASFADFERAYGGLAPLDSTAGPVPNYVAHALAHIRLVCSAFSPPYALPGTLILILR
jgi:hypothetical protein